MRPDKITSSGLDDYEERGHEFSDRRGCYHNNNSSDSENKKPKKGEILTFSSCASVRATCSKLCCSSNRYCAFLNMYPVIRTLYMSCARFSAT